VGSSDEALLAGLAAGDRDASAEFVRRFQRRVYGLAWTIVRDRGTAEDVAQEAFVRAWRYGASYDARRGSVLTWLLTIARNVAVDRLRLKQPEPLDTELLEAKLRVGDAPDEQRRALLLASYFGRTAAEIAAAERIPLGTAKTRIRTGMRRLRAELEVSDG